MGCKSVGRERDIRSKGSTVAPLQYTIYTGYTVDTVYGFRVQMDGAGATL